MDVAEKRKSFVGGESVDIEEGELNVLLSSPNPSDPNAAPAKPGQPRRRARRPSMDGGARGGSWLHGGGGRGLTWASRRGCEIGGPDDPGYSGTAIYQINFSVSRLLAFSLDDSSASYLGTVNSA